MNNTENPSTGSWERIQGGVRETERLIGQKKYNLSMIKARQTLEFMVKNLCDKAGIVESGLIDMIDALFENGSISKTTCEHYHKIRTIGNKATHEEDNSAYNANQAHHLLSQEVYTFANDYGDKKKRAAAVPSRSTSSRNTPSRTASPRQGEDQPRRKSSSSGRSNSRRRKARKSGFSIDPGSLLKPLLLIAIIVVLIFIIKMIRPEKEKVVETTAPVTTEMTTVAETTTEETETVAPTTEAPVVYKTNDTVNVRSTPSTDTARIGVLAPGTVVEYVREHDEKWCVIKYNGSEAYAAKEFIVSE